MAQRFNDEHRNDYGLPLGQPPPDAPPGPPEPDGGHGSGGLTRSRRERKLTDYVSTRVDYEMEQAWSAKRTIGISDADASGCEADVEDKRVMISRSDLVADGKGRRTGARLALAATSSADAELLPAMAGRRNSLMGSAAFRDPKKVVAELPVGVVNMRDMPARIDYDNDEDHQRDYEAWRKANVRAQVNQQRHAASQEKKVGLVNDWMQRQGYLPFVEWRLADEGVPESGWELHLIVDVKKGKGGKKEMLVPRLPSVTGLSEWAFAYSTGKAPKGGEPEYRAGPWYGLINGKTQAEILMPEDQRKAYGWGSFAAEPPRYITIEQTFSAMRQWLKRALRDYPTFANPLDSQVVRDITATLESAEGRAPVEVRLPRALSEEEIENVISSARVTAESAGSLLAAIEESQNLLYIMKNSVHGDRAHDSYWYNHGDVLFSPAGGEEGARSGSSWQRVATKNNKKQWTDKKLLQCNSTCCGKFAITEQGTPDVDALCVVHLAEHVKGLVLELLGLEAIPAELPFFADFCRVRDLKAGATLVVASANSVADKAGLCVCNVTAEELSLGIMYDRTVPFEYNGKQYLQIGRAHV